MRRRRQAAFAQLVRGARRMGSPRALPLPRLARSAAAGFGAWAVALVKGLHGRWRRSLQLRVVSTTLVVSVAVVSLLGFFLMQQIAANLLQSAKAQSHTQASDGLVFAQADPAALKPPGPDSQDLVFKIVSSLKSSGQSPGADYGVAVTVRRDLSPPAYWAAVQSSLDYHSLPPSVAQSARGHAGKPVKIFASMPYPNSTSPKTSGLLYAAPFGFDNDYELYYFFPLSQLQNELVLIQRTLVLVGLALVFLLAGIAWLVTRWVVLPVVRAAHGAKLLSTGRLDERLAVHGEDEVAALATSFNEMAAGLQDKMRELEELSQVQRQFVSDVSHELRTPLTTIRMAADLLFEAREQLESAAARSAELLQSQLGRFELLNLLCNAVEHGEGRDVVVTSAADRDAVAVAVRDFGVGLAPGEEHLVFDRFWRADPARARTTGGTGLGLAIALEDARLHGGWLEAWGERAKGSVFRLTLPREVGAKLAGSPLPLAPDQADFGSLAAETAADLRVTVHRARFRAPAPIEDRR